MNTILATTHRLVYPQGLPQRQRAADTTRLPSDFRYSLMRSIQLNTTKRTNTRFCSSTTVINKMGRMHSDVHITYAARINWLVLFGPIVWLPEPSLWTGHSEAIYRKSSACQANLSRYKTNQPIILKLQVSDRTHPCNSEQHLYVQISGLSLSLLAVYELIQITVVIIVVVVCCIPLFTDTAVPSIRDCPRQHIFHQYVSTHCTIHEADPMATELGSLSESHQNR